MHVRNTNARCLKFICAKNWLLLYLLIYSSFKKTNIAVLFALFSRIAQLNALVSDFCQFKCYEKQLVNENENSQFMYYLYILLFISVIFQTIFLIEM